MSNVFGIIYTLANVMNVSASYKKFLSTAYLKDTESLRLIYNNVGSSGRVVLQCIANNCKNKIVEELVEYLIIMMVVDGQLECEMKEEEDQ